MRKSTFIKRFVALLLVVLMSIESFAAVVGDNDGAAFITKAEFDSLKNDFQSQLDRYNSSLDNKIDGAIASYLAGVKESKKETIKLSSQTLDSSYNLYWTSNDNFGLQTTRPIMDYTFNFQNIWLETAAQFIWEKPGSMDWQYSGFEKNGGFIVNNIKKVNPKFVGYSSYFLLPECVAGSAVRNRWPSDTLNPAIRMISFNNPAVYNYRAILDSGTQPDDWTRYDFMVRKDWRFTDGAVIYSESPVASDSIIYSPFSTTNVYVYHENVGDMGNQTISIANNVYFTTERYGERVNFRDLVDIRNNSHGALLDPALLSADSFQLRLPAINDTRTHIPWLDVSYTVNQLIYNPVGLASGEYIPQAGGLPLTTAERDGTWELHFTPDHDGYAMFYVGSRPTYNWGTPSSQVSNINYVECNAGDQSTVTFDALRGNRLYFIYYPVDTSVLAKVSFDDSYFIS